VGRSSTDELNLSRRQVIAGAAALAAVGPRFTLPAASAQPAIEIVPRSAWGPDLLPAGEVPDEPDVRFLLVHHTVDRNDYAPEETVELLRTIYRFHTSPARGWPDVAYNFFVDRYGVIYEGRTGSLDRAKAADATGGSQGFAQLGCFVGDHSVEAPTDAAVASMGGLLGWLAARHALDVSPGATTTFVSRGSNLHPAGSEVTTSTIAGHRDMSETACPGDFAYAFVADGTFARLASGTAAPATTAAPTTAAPTTTAEPTTTAAPATTPSTESAVPPPATTPAPEDDDPIPLPALVIAGAAGLVLAGIVLRRRGA
jgi:hypothetical protein